MSQARTVVLDNEAVQALLNPRHRKHRRALGVVEAIAARNLRRSGTVSLVVPTTVRVEAGWNRRAPGAAAINCLRVDDAELDSGAADRAVPVRSDLGVSVADAHLATVIATTASPHAVVTSDTQDLRRIAEHLAVPISVVTL